MSQELQRVEGEERSLEKSNLLAAYIKSKYGPVQLGLLRLLFSFADYRDAVGRGDHHQYGIPQEMLSFEKVLKETENIHYDKRPTASGIAFSVTTPRGRRTYIDDEFSTVSSAVVEHIFALYPKLHAYKRGPLVQLGCGVDVVRAVDSIDLEELAAYVTKLPEPYAAAVKRFNDNRESMVDSVDGASITTMLAYYGLYEAIHEIFSSVRLEEPVVEGFVGEQLPFAEGADKSEVLFGAKRLSLRFDKAPVPSMRKTLDETHPDGKWRDNCFILRDAFDPFALIKSKRVAIGDPLSAGLEVIGEPVVVGDVAQVNYGSCGEGVDAAVAMVIELQCEDYNRLAPEEKMRYLYGGPTGKQIWESMSQLSRSKLLKNMPDEVMSPQAWISLMAEYVGRHARKGFADPDIYGLCAGRTLGFKAQIEFGASSWRKK
jgi:hypothetical protein